MARPPGFKIIHWSEDDVTRLRQGWRVLSDDELAELLSRTKKAVKEKRERLGLMRFEKPSKQ